MVLHKNKYLRNKINVSVFLPAKFCLSPAIAGRVYFAGGLFP